MKQARIFKYEDVEDKSKTAFVISFEETEAKSRLTDFTSRPIRLAGTIFAEDVPGYLPSSEFSGAKVIKNNIDPF